MTLAPAVAGRAGCATPEGLVLVDAAFKRPGSPAQRELERICAECPMWEPCLRQALDQGEHGPWGGTTERLRRTNPKARRPYNANIHGLHPPDHTRTMRRRNNPLHRLGVTHLQVKQWAHHVGLLDKVTPRGIASSVLIDAYLEAHHLTAA